MKGSGRERIVGIGRIFSAFKSPSGNGTTFADGKRAIRDPIR